MSSISQDHLTILACTVPTPAWPPSAVQNLNLSLGLPEWMGLKVAGGYPG